eukprot:TRINITY_DN4319_c0_g1_i1.p2 TRINITY_DN4319_c0_g1~~TRINITY_DN4319_c0_g1_i1.p2  ORF type:complete len:108 (-),score=22.32 TRINITY_DN4319_c0_g1_i1:135-458(-)
MESAPIDPSTVTMESTQKLLRQKDDIEKEMSEIRGRLLLTPVGLSGSVIDEQGFPRADIDIPAIRADRHRLACLQTDLKTTVGMIEECIYILHARAREEKQGQTAGQ